MDGYPRLDEFKDFRRFLCFLWRRLGLPDPTPVQYDIAAKLQSGGLRLMVQAFRGVGKSWITAAYVLWRLYWNPDLNILVVSATEKRAFNFTTFCLRLLTDIPELNWLHPASRAKPSGSLAATYENRASKAAFDVGPAPAAQAPSVRACGILGQITGDRADIIIADDIETAVNALTQAAREKLALVVVEFDNIVKPETGQIIYLGTPQTEESIYNTLPERGYKVTIWPAQYPRKSRLVAYGDRLAPFIRKALEADPKLCGMDGEEETGLPTDPARFDETELTKRRLGLSRAQYSLQFMLDPSGMDAAAHPLRMRDLVIADIPNDVGPPTVIWSSSPENQDKTLPCYGFRGDMVLRAFKLQGDFIPFEDSIMYIDPSGRGSDETGYCVMKTLNGTLFALKCGGFRGGYEPDTLTALAKIAKEYSVKRVVTEDDFGDGMWRTLFLPVLRQEYPKCGIDGVKVPRGMNKERRIIEVLEPVVQQHRLVVHSDVLRDDAKETPDVAQEDQFDYRLFYQYTRITREKHCLSHDDRLDALAGAVAVFQATLNIDRSKHLESVLRREQDRQQRLFLKEIGEAPQNPTWMHKLVGNVCAPTPLKTVRRKKGGGFITSADIW